ncbi:class I SAM-dependent methyltransferase [Halocynthiibacter styelae]|uniref:class I SAM-dependent methyltransferase n=1 Tax=Halocynthiibacter styelae TaxID=2761955 RepID=UPI001E297938|nr:class I SAM-dependent methyltransferase [Paenihalocynthiibacter styelae]
MASLPTISALWMEGSLSFLEQLCMKSFVDAGHEVILYHYGPLQNVPAGIELADANTILPQKNFLKHERTGSPALHSDLFRYKMLEQSQNTIWADTDAYCMKPFETPNGHFYGWESKTHINGGVLGLPADSETLRELLEFTSDEFAIPSYYGPEYERELQEKKDAGNPVHASEQPWGVWGPHAVTHFLHKTGEAKFALPQEGLYPFTFKDRRMMLKRNFDTSPYITEDTYSVHLYGRRMRARLVEKEGGAPHRKSLLGQLLVKHDIDPAAAPLPMSRAQKEAAVQETAPAQVSAPLTEPVPASEKYGRGQVNLTDLADQYGSDKGSNKHRYTELYQMLFLPYRKRKIDFLEMGLQIGGPEHGNHADRETTDLPSIRIWLEYFTKAHIHGLDVSDFSWFKDDRFTFHRCDMDTRENIRNATQEMEEFDIIIDDASHASHHQQNGFLELFPKIKSGGLYVIEDLRWQPDVMEKPGITKTADFFQTYLKTGVFSHSDPEVAAAFNAHRHDISGCFVYQAQFDKRRKDQVLVVNKR